MVQSAGLYPSSRLVVMRSLSARVVCFDHSSGGATMKPRWGVSIVLGNPQMIPLNGSAPKPPRFWASRTRFCK